MRQLLWRYCAECNVSDVLLASIADRTTRDGYGQNCSLVPFQSDPILLLDHMPSSLRYQRHPAFDDWLSKHLACAAFCMQSGACVHDSALTMVLLTYLHCSAISIAVAKLPVHVHYNIDAHASIAPQERYIACSVGSSLGQNWSSILLDQKAYNLLTMTIALLTYLLCSAAISIAAAELPVHMDREAVTDAELLLTSVQSADVPDWTLALALLLDDQHAIAGRFTHTSTRVIKNESLRHGRFDRRFQLQSLQEALLPQLQHGVLFTCPCLIAFATHASAPRPLHTDWHMLEGSCCITGHKASDFQCWVTWSKQSDFCEHAGVRPALGQEWSTLEKIILTDKQYSQIRKAFPSSPNDSST